MPTIVDRHTSVPQPRSWMRAGAVALAGIAIAMSIGLEIRTGTDDDADVDSRATSFEPSAEAGRLGALARDHAEYQIEAFREMRASGS